MNKRENTLAAMHGDKTDYTPCFYDSIQLVPTDLFLECPPPVNGKKLAGYDGYGVYQEPTESGDGAYTPAYGIPPVLTDVTEWKSQVKFPDYSIFSEDDWKQSAAEMEARIDRREYVIDAFSLRGMFERMHALMGFEDAMIALLEEPEACYDLAGAIADHKIRQIEYVAKYYKPDYFTYLDDYAHKSGLFMSKQTFRTIFKPHLKRIVDAVHASGMIFRQHCCGKMEDLFEDFLELGITAFDPVQPYNDIPAMKEKAKGKAGILGGLDVQNVVDMENATEEDIRAEVRRCINEYGEGGGYMVYGSSIYMRNEKQRQPGGRIWTVIDECKKFGKL